MSRELSIVAKEIIIQRLNITRGAKTFSLYVVPFNGGIERYILSAHFQIPPRVEIPQQPTMSGDIVDSIKHYTELMVGFGHHLHLEMTTKVSCEEEDQKCIHYIARIWRDGIYIMNLPLVHVSNSKNIYMKHIFPMGQRSEF